MSSRGAPQLFFGADGASIDYDPATGLYNIKRGDGTVILSMDASGNITIPGSATKIKGRTLAGLAGLPLIVSAPAVLADQTGAVSNFLNFTPPAAAGVYCVFYMVNVTAWTTPASFTAQVTYKDNKGNARTETLTFTRGSTGAGAQAITAVDRWYGTSLLIAIDNSHHAFNARNLHRLTGLSDRRSYRTGDLK
jgi:hypothetical protein